MKKLTTEKLWMDFRLSGNNGNIGIMPLKLDVEDTDKTNRQISSIVKIDFFFFFSFFICSVRFQIN